MWFFVSCMYFVFCVFPGFYCLVVTRLQNDLLCVECDVKPYTLTHSLVDRVQAVVIVELNLGCGLFVEDLVFVYKLLEFSVFYNMYLCLHCKSL